MSSIGNDNYRPGLKPPEPMKNGGGWLSSNMAQLMVFLNGLILTVTAFATLSVFIDEIVKEGLLKTSQEVEQYIFSGYNETERSLHALSTVSEVLATSKQIPSSDLNEFNEINEYLSFKSAGAENFDQIYWIQKQENESWSLTSLTGGEGYSSRFDNNSDFIDFIRLEALDQEKRTHMITSLPHSKQRNREASAQIYDRIFGLVEVQGDLKNPTGYIVGIGNLHTIIDAEWLSQRPSIKDVQVVDTSADLPIYSYRLGKDGGADSSSTSSYTSIFSNMFVEEPIEVTVQLTIGSREAFLQKIPLLMLLFGITLTLIGTLYVRNNQSQSQKLSDMNKELAHKNFELNQEVNERERLNEVIHRSARENRSIINAVSDIIFEVSIDGRLLFLNDAWNKVTGFESERSIGRDLFDLIYASDQEEQRQNFEQLVKGQKQSYRVFTKLRSADGGFRAVELAVSMLRQDENKDLRVVGTITDVEERRRAEHALSEAEKKYRAIVENAAGGIYQVTPEGQFLSANPAFAKVIGYDTSEEVLRDIQDANKQLYVDSTLREAFLKDLATLNISKKFESQIVRKDGEKIWVSESIRPVRDDAGALLFYEGSMEDVDQRRKAEIGLKEAIVESDLANRAKSEFLANMSHELRTPLNSVIGFSEIIKNEAFGDIPQPEYKEYANNIFESGNNLLNVINEILDLSRIQAGDRTLNEGIVNVAETVDSCLALMDGKIKSNKMRVENKIKGSDLSFVGETQALKQMILNLMSNAVKFSPEGGFIMLDAEIGRQGRLRVSVTDTGIGLTDEELVKALSPFGQVDSEHKRSKSGTGLGLTLVKSLMELHGGGLDIVSQKNIGTTATLIFPEKRVVLKKSAEDISLEKQSESAESAHEDVTDKKDA